MLRYSLSKCKEIKNIFVKKNVISVMEISSLKWKEKPQPRSEMLTQLGTGNVI